MTHILRIDEMLKNQKSRVFTTKHGETVKAEMMNNGRVFIEFYVKTGSDEEFDPWSYSCETNDLNKGGLRNKKQERIHHSWWNMNCFINIYNKNLIN